jgi:hypothetical protein
MRANFKKSVVFDVRVPQVQRNESFAVSDNWNHSSVRRFLFWKRNTKKKTKQKKVRREKLEKMEGTTLQ